MAKHNSAFFEQVVHTSWKAAQAQIGGQDIHIAAAFGNAGEESGGFLKLVEKPGKEEGGVNGWQWTGIGYAANGKPKRRTAFRNFAASLGKSELDVGAGVAFFIEECKPGGTYRHAWEQTCRTTDLISATETFMLLYESPATQGGRPTYGTARLDVRLEWAQIALDIIRGEKPVTDTSSSLPVALNEEQIAAHLVLLHQKLDQLIAASPASNPFVSMALGILDHVPIEKIAAHTIATVDFNKLAHQAIGALLSALGKKLPAMALLIVSGAVALAVSSSGVLAADTIMTNSAPWGDWVTGILSHIQTVAVAAAGTGLTFLGYRLPVIVRPLINAMVQEQWLSRAIDYGFAAVEGAVKGKVLDLKTSNAVIAHAEAYAIATAPVLASKIGDLLLPKLVARLSGSMAPDVTASQLNASVSRPALTK